MATINETAAEQDSDAGMEIDAHATYKLADNCDLNLTVGYWMVGDGVAVDGDDATLFSQEICIKF